MSSEDDILSSFQIMFPGHVIDRMNTLGVDSDACFWAADHKSYTSTELRLQKFVDGAVEVSIRVMKLGGTTNLAKRNAALKQSNFVRTSVYGKDKLQRECQPVGRFIFQKTLNSIADPKRKGRGRPCNASRNLNPQKSMNQSISGVTKEVGTISSYQAAPLVSSPTHLVVAPPQKYVVPAGSDQPRHLQLKTAVLPANPRTFVLRPQSNPPQLRQMIVNPPARRVNISQPAIPNILQRQVTSTGGKQVHVVVSRGQKPTANTNTIPGNSTVVYVDSRGRLMTPGAVAALSGVQRGVSEIAPSRQQPQQPLRQQQQQQIQQQQSDWSTLQLSEPMIPGKHCNLGVDIVQMAVAECISKPEALEQNAAPKSLDEGLNPGDFLLKVIKEDLPRKKAMNKCTLIVRQLRDNVLSLNNQNQHVSHLHYSLRMRNRRRFKCLKCNKHLLKINDFKSKLRLKWTGHICTWPRFTCHRCRHCTHRFSTYAETRAHFATAHRWRHLAADAPFRCPVCSAGYYVEENYLKHKLSSHNELSVVTGETKSLNEKTSYSATETI